MTLLQDLRLGAGFVLRSGREGWIRTVLTAVGVGLGVALMLLATAIPRAFDARNAREVARAIQIDAIGKRSADTVLLSQADTTYRGQDITGMLVRAEGDRPPVPPGLTALPGPGEMAVSPALDKLLKSSRGELLRERLNYHTTAIMDEAGLIGPGELVYYAGSDAIEPGGDRVLRSSGWGLPELPQTRDPALTLLVLIGFAALLMPVAVFMAAAVRFGGERRDRRLAALRLIGADSRSARWIAAGEAMAGALLGLAFGAVFFLIARQLAGRVSLYTVRVFPADLEVSLTLAALVAVAVPAVAVAVTLFTLRGVIIEPLGVVRTQRPARRRIGWRLVLPAAGVAVLLPLTWGDRHQPDINEPLAIGGVVVLLVCVNVLLPALVEVSVARLHSGGVSWQLAVRRLQMSSAGAARQVSGIAVAVAGAIALQMLFAGLEPQYNTFTGQDASRATLSVSGRVSGTLGHIEGVTKARSLTHGQLAARPGTRQAAIINLIVGGCADLREVARLPSCRDGDVFIVHAADTGDLDLAKPGARLYLSPIGSNPTSARSPAKRNPWTLPTTAKTADVRQDPTGSEYGGILATSGAAPRIPSTAPRTVFIRLDPSVPDAVEYVRNAAEKADPTARVLVLNPNAEDPQFANIRTGLLIGATCVLLLIGASILIDQLEQLRERRKLLSTLVAFGIKRSTLSFSILWQTAFPVILGLSLATAVGLGLGAVLLRMAGTPIRIDWTSVGILAGTGGGVVLAVTALSLPALIRLMRPDGLRTE